MTASGIDTSLVVTTYRRPRHLELVLASIAAQTGVPRDFEVVVSDDGSEDETADVVGRFAGAADFPVFFTTQPHAGFRLSRVRNNGARLARGRYLLFVDGDCVLPGHHLAAHRRRRRPAAALLGFCARLSEATSRPLVESGLGSVDLGGLVGPTEAGLLRRRHRRARWHSVIRHPTKPRLAGGDFGLWRGDFERVNGFDERFEGWGQEDDDLGLRLRAAGVRLESILDATCSLHVWHPTDPTATTRWRDGVNVGYFERRGRLTACRRGLVRRELGDLLWGLPPDSGSSRLGRRLEEVLDGCPIAPGAAACEVAVAIGTSGRGLGRESECRLLVISDGTAPRGRVAATADRTVAIAADDPATLRAVLDDVG